MLLIQCIAAHYIKRLYFSTKKNCNQLFYRFCFIFIFIFVIMKNERNLLLKITANA